jgi:hypothetical protein
VKVLAKRGNENPMSVAFGAEENSGMHRGDLPIIAQVVSAKMIVG